MTFREIKLISTIMEKLLQSLEHQKRREKQQIIELNPGPTQSPEWFLIQAIEDLAQALSSDLASYLSHHSRLTKQEVKMENHQIIPSEGRMRLRAQIIALDRKQVTIKVHCHRLGMKGEHQRITRATYRYRRSA